MAPGEGIFCFERHIVVNDSNRASYKTTTSTIDVSERECAKRRKKNILSTFLRFFVCIFIAHYGVAEAGLWNNKRVRAVARRH